MHTIDVLHGCMRKVGSHGLSTEEGGHVRARAWHVPAPAQDARNVLGGLALADLDGVGAQVYGVSSQLKEALSCHAPFSAHFITRLAAISCHLSNQRAQNGAEGSHLYPKMEQPKKKSRFCICAITSVQSASAAMEDTKCQHAQSGKSVLTLRQISTQRGRTSCSST